MLVKARCTCGPHEPFQATTIERRNLGPHDILIDIAYAGICHSDVGHARSLRGSTRFAASDRAGVGNMVYSCGACASFRAGLEQYCSGGRVLTYGAISRDGRPTRGGYSERIVVDERFAMRIPDGIALANAAPLFCAGITMYSPLRLWRAGPDRRVGTIGFGGLGYIWVQIARALGAHTTAFDLSPAKHDDSLRLGADAFRHRHRTMAKG
jgi:alcohol dehydrogenase (NADP+)